MATCSLAGNKTKTYEFPDGYGAQFGAERYALTESIFNPEAYLDKVSLDSAEVSNRPLALMH